MRGRGVLLLGILLVMPVVSGCIFFPDDGLEEIFGSERVHGFPGNRLLSDVLEVRAVDENGPGEWSRSLTWTTGDTLVIEKSPPGPQGGGGETHELPAPDLPKLELRFDNAPRLANLTAHWTVYAGGENVEELRENAAQTIVFEPPYPGVFEVRAALERAGDAIARTFSSSMIQMVAGWTVESSVFPFRVQDTPPQENYDEMRDIFRFEVAGGRPAVQLETAFRGDYNPATDGTDVDLGLYDPAQAVLQCIGAGGGGSPLPDPAAAEEWIFHPALSQAGTYTVHVGSLHESCSSETWYHNQGPVPYRLTVQLGVAEPSEPGP